MPVAHRVQSNGIGNRLGPRGPGLDFLGCGTGLVRVGAKGLNGVNAMIDEVPSTGHGPPSIARSHHARTRVARKNKHP